MSAQLILNHISTHAPKGNKYHHNTYNNRGREKRKWIELSFSCDFISEAKQCPTFCSCYDNGTLINSLNSCHKFATSTTTTTTTTTTTATTSTATKSDGGGGGNTTTIIVGVTIPIVIFLILGLMLALFLWRKRKKGDETLDRILFCIKRSGSNSAGSFAPNVTKSVHFLESPLSQYESLNNTFGKAQIFTLDMLDISNTLGRGAYGKVIIAPTGAPGETMSGPCI